MSIFVSVVLPVLLVFGIGYAVEKWKKVDIGPISVVAIYIMTPCLVFETFYDADIDRQYLFMVIFSIALLAVLIIVNKIVAKIAKQSKETESGFILSTAFMNSGNYGAPIILFAYGDEGFAYAVSFLVLQAIIMNLFGVYYAAKGHYGVGFAIRSVFKMPATYAVVLGVIVQSFGWTMPENIMMTVNIIAEATIPTVMIILGMQLAKMEWGQFAWGKVSYATVVRLFVSPLIAVGLTMIMPMDPLLSKVLIISAAMPSAATIVMYAVQFNTQPRYVSSVTLVSTVLSVGTITLLLSIL
ncbi:AEC family transporter [Salibacterium salarium]|uniref:AEC family transporter n=1 Tax=Salibacterium salarium TaxID=284579 RepID=A0A428NAD5_9BACI|nr:AEC family transporter [Salibacterium salarium]RSL35346.1 AEC family transporter [Salibacterium salarium]